LRRKPENYSTISKLVLTPENSLTWLQIKGRAKMLTRFRHKSLHVVVLYIFTLNQLAMADLIYMRDESVVECVVEKKRNAYFLTYTLMGPDGRVSLQARETKDILIETGFENSMITGEAYLAKGEYREAVNHFEDALTYSPDNEGAVLALKEAKEVLEQSRKVARKGVTNRRGLLPDYHRQKVDVAIRARRNVMALQHLKTLIEVDYKFRNTEEYNELIARIEKIEPPDYRHMRNKRKFTGLRNQKLIGQVLKEQQDKATEFDRLKNEAFKNIKKGNAHQSVPLLVELHTSYSMRQNEIRNLLETEVQELEKNKKRSRTERHRTALYYMGALYGVPEAQYQFGKRVLFGDGAKKNQSLGQRYLERAADQRHEDAILLLGELYFGGRHGFAKNTSTATFWNKKAALMGNETGQLRYGLQLARGEGVAKDLDKGIEFIRKSAKSGNQEARKFINKFDAEVARRLSEQQQKEQRAMLSAIEDMRKRDQQVASSRTRRRRYRSQQDEAMTIVAGGLMLALMLGAASSMSSGGSWSGGGGDDYDSYERQMMMRDYEARQRESQGLRP
jgi:tetratricopeptide (TPR) repeat protein